MTKKEAVISIIKSWDDEEIVKQWNDYCEFHDSPAIMEVFTDDEDIHWIIDKFPHCNDSFHDYFYIDDNGWLMFFSDALGECSPIDLDKLSEYLIDYFKVDDDKMAEIFVAEYFPKDSAKAREIVKKLCEIDEINIFIDEWDEVLTIVKKHWND